MGAEAELKRRLRQGLHYGRQRNWPLTTVHGDLSCSNLAIHPSGQLVLLDWENFSPSGLVAADLVRFCYDIELDAKRLKPAQFEALLAKARALLMQQLYSMDFTAEDYAALEAVFIAHQLQCTGSKAPPFRPLIDLYLSRASTLAA
jgi:thiamine kinase-like enzyme